MNALKGMHASKCSSQCQLPVEGIQWFSIHNDLLTALCRCLVLWLNIWHIPSKTAQTSRKSSRLFIHMDLLSLKTKSESLKWRQRD